MNNNESMQDFIADKASKRYVSKEIRRNFQFHLNKLIIEVKTLGKTKHGRIHCLICYIIRLLI